MNALQILEAHADENVTYTKKSHFFFSINDKFMHIKLCFTNAPLHEESIKLACTINPRIRSAHTLCYLLHKMIKIFKLQVSLGGLRGKPTRALQPCSIIYVWSTLAPTNIYPSETEHGDRRREPETVISIHLG